MFRQTAATRTHRRAKMMHKKNRRNESNNNNSNINTVYHSSEMRSYRVWRLNLFEIIIRDVL